jgi:acetylglutamate kinase
MDKVSVIKIGGNVLNDPEKLEAFLHQFSQLKGRKILVHGGGVIATQMAERSGIPVQMKEGRRITDDQMIDVVVMTYGGLVNKQIVARLLQKGIHAIGLTGADGNLILSDKRPPVNGLDYGWVGDPKEVNTTFLNTLLGSGLTPVVAPLTHDGKGHLLNTNADTMAQFTAVALAKESDVELIYAFELDGVLEDVEDAASLIKTIDPEKYQQLKSKGIIHSGMIPKLDNAFTAIEAGLSSVSLVKFDLLSKLEEQGFDAFTRLHR